MSELIHYLKRIYPAQESSNLSWEFKVDDRDGDVAHEFCNMTLTAGDDSSQFTLTLFPVPTSDGLLEFVQKLGGETVEQRYGTMISLVLEIRQVTVIRRLAKEIRRITGRGQSYLNPNWKWICRRTADSLDRLATNLFEFRRAKRHGLLERVEEEDEGLFALVD